MQGSKELTPSVQPASRFSMPLCKTQSRKNIWPFHASRIIIGIKSLLSPTRSHFQAGISGGEASLLIGESNVQNQNIKTCKWNFQEVTHSSEAFGFISVAIVCFLSCIFFFFNVLFVSMTEPKNRVSINFETLEA